MHPISFLLAAVLVFAVPTHTIVSLSAKLAHAAGAKSAGPRWV